MRRALALMVLWLFASNAGAEEISYSVRAVSSSSGAHDGDARGVRLAWTHDVDAGNVPWVRVFFGAGGLGPDSYVEIHGVGEGQYQRLDASSMRDWNDASAAFRGGRIRIELYVGPNERNVRLDIVAIMNGDFALHRDACGTDDRFAFNDQRVARMFPVACTAWAIGNGAYLTAGHCVDLDPDGDGPLLPDGISDLGGLIEFNVPPSGPDGSLVPAQPNDQYPVNAATVVWRNSGTPAAEGNDWAIFGINRNATTGLMPYEAYGAQPFRLTREAPAVGSNLRVTGYGTDSGLANQTCQTGFGPFQGEFGAEPAIRLEHRVDTQPGNSGSPILWEDLGLAVGIHTHGGCSLGPAENNLGTSFEVDALEAAINTFLGVGTQYVDPGHPLRVSADGTLARPWATVADGIAQVPTNGTVAIHPGVWGFQANAVITAPCVLRAPAGAVIILGN